jgi:hypothetical protein
MEYKKTFPQITGLMLIIFFLIACRTPEPEATPTHVSPTVVPTQTIDPPKDDPEY